VAPGTFGSIGASILIYFTFNSTFLFHFSTFALFTGLSYFFIYLTTQNKVYALNDPSWVVQDEFSGLYLTFLLYKFCFPHPGTSFMHIGIILVSFRIFDIWKPWPINKIDETHTPFSIMNDDLAAGVYAGALSCALIFLAQLN